MSILSNKAALNIMLTLMSTSKYLTISAISKSTGLSEELVQIHLEILQHAGLVASHFGTPIEDSNKIERTYTYSANERLDSEIQEVRKSLEADGTS